MLTRLLDRNAEHHGSRTALVASDERLTWAELRDRVDRVALGLSALGVGPDDTAVIMLPATSEFVVGVLALGRLGAAAALLNVQSKEHELSSAFADCQPKVVITDRPGAGISQAVAERIGYPVTVVSTDATPSSAVPFSALITDQADATLPTLAPADRALIYQYSSGSTGRPKRVVRTQAQCAAEAEYVSLTLELTPDDAILCVIPLFHAYGLGDCLFTSLGSAAKLVIQSNPNPFMVKRQRTLELIEEERVTFFPGVPYQFELLAKARSEADLSSLRYCTSAGVGLSRDIFDAFLDRFGIPLRQLYGCTESPSLSVNLEDDVAATTETVGRAMVGNEIVIRTEDGAAAPVGTVGAVSVRSAASSSGYVGSSHNDHETFRDGWVFPGDLGFLDDEGRLTIVGRTKIFIDVVGHKVDPLEVEDVLATHPAVDESVVVGTCLVEGKGEVVKAVVVVKEPVSELELIRYCSERLAPFKVPQVVEFVDAIPRSPIGKILRKELI